MTNTRLLARYLPEEKWGCENIREGEAPGREPEGRQKPCVRILHSPWMARRGRRAVRTLLLPVALLLSMQAAYGQGLRQALEPRVAKLSSKSHSAVLLWDLPRRETLAAVRGEMFAAPRCLGSLVKPFLLLAYLNERCTDLTSHPLEVPPCPTGDDRADPQTPRSEGISIELQPCVGRVTPQCPVECWYKPGHGGDWTERG